MDRIDREDLAGAQHPSPQLPTPNPQPLTSNSRDGAVVLIFQPRLAEARHLAERCRSVVESAGYEMRLISAWDLGPDLSNSGLSLAVTFGGDGTIIRAARWLAGSGTPILGVAMGRLGFMTELAPEVACERLPAVLAGNYWTDERSMLSATLHPAPVGAEDEDPPYVGMSSPDGVPLIALNDVVVGRGASLRVAHIDVAVDGVLLGQYVADALIVATPTGSTAYSLAAGGPVMAPDVQGLVVTPVAAHLSVLRSLVVPASARIEVSASSDQPTLVVLDGQLQLPLKNNQLVTVELAKEKTVFARTGSRTRFYETLVQSLKKR